MRSFGSTIISRVVVHFPASMATGVYQMTNFSSLIRNEGELGEQKVFSGSGNREQGPAEVGDGHNMIQRGR